jgi:hypothetical protein
MSHGLRGYDTRSAITTRRAAGMGGSNEWLYAILGPKATPPSISGGRRSSRRALWNGWPRISPRIETPFADLLPAKASFSNIVRASPADITFIRKTGPF